MSDDEIEARKKKAERGWLTDPPPPPPREYIPGEEHKWRVMMDRRYAHLRDRPRPWVADLTKRTRKEDGA